MEKEQVKVDVYHSTEKHFGKLRRLVFTIF